MNRLLLLVFLLSSGLGHAADEGRPISCRLLAFGGRAAGSIDAMVAGVDGALAPCSFSSSSISKPISCVVIDNRIRFLTAEDQKEIAVASIPPKVRNALVVLVATGKEAVGEAWHPFVIDDSAKNYPDGGAFVANFQPGNIRFVIGEHKGMLKPGKSFGYKRPEERNTFNMAPVVVEFEKDSKWVTANESELRFLPGMRYLMFAYLDPVSGRPRVKTYQDHSVPPAAGG